MHALEGWERTNTNKELFIGEVPERSLNESPKALCGNCHSGGQAERPVKPAELSLPKLGQSLDKLTKENHPRQLFTTNKQE